MIALTKRPAWKALKAHQKKIKSLHLRKLFDADPKRGQRMTVEAAGLFLDYSKNRIVDQTVKLLLQLANESCLRERIDAMFSGEKINITENRAVLHVALRAPRGASIIVDGKNVVPQVHVVLDEMIPHALMAPTTAVTPWSLSVIVELPVLLTCTGTGVLFQRRVGESRV